MTFPPNMTTGTSADLQIRLFGAPDIIVKGAALPPLHSRKGLWLFSLLVLKWKQPVDRNWLAGTLWPESDHRESLKNLRNTLSDLRRALGPHGHRIESQTPGTLRLDITGADADVLAFDALLLKGGKDCLTSAIELYRGSLLEGCDEEWIVIERERRQQACLDALEAVAEIDLNSGDTAMAARRLRSCIAIDPFRETAQCSLMSALAAAGDYAAVTHVYREFRLLLHEQLNTQPAGETTSLYQSIRVQARQVAAGGSAPARKVFAPSNSSSSSARAMPAEHHVVYQRLGTTHNLPPPLTSFIGREKECAVVIRMLENTRLLTLTGAGGSGKTRLSIEAAYELVSIYPDGVWLVELAAFLDPSQVAMAVAAVLDIREQPGIPISQTLVASLKSKEMVLLLDNCEHLLAACAQLVKALLRGCPNLRLVATSRERLGIVGEQTFRVPSLSLHVLNPPESEGSIQECEAVRLFAARARLINSDFHITHLNAKAVAHVCHRLDGMPLAIELAAAWLRSISVEDLRTRLDERFDLLTGGDKSALPRQQTLSNLIGWSYDLLDGHEKLMLQQVAVFTGTWTLKAAEQVCAPNTEYPTPKTGQTCDVLDLITSLIDKSLVIAEQFEGTVRYRLLETIRQYAWDRLESGGLIDVVRSRHLDHYLALAEEAAPKLQGEELPKWLAVLEAEHDNLRQALAFCRDREGDIDKGLRLASALERFWSTRGYLGEGREHLNALLNRSAALVRTKARGDALSGAGALALYQGDYPAARSLHEESLSIRRELGDRAGTAASLRSVGGAALALFDYISADSLLHESLEINQELGDRRGIALCLLGLGALASQQGQGVLARSYYEQSLERYRDLGNKRGIASSLLNLGAIAQEEHDYRIAKSLYGESLAIRRELGDKGGISSSLNNMADLAYEQQDYESARSLYEQSMKIRVECSHRPGIASSLRSLGNIACEQGDYASARARYDEAVAIWRELAEKPRLSECLLMAGSASFCLGHYDSARYSYKESLKISDELGDIPGIANAISKLAELSVDGGNMERAVLLWGAAVALREQTCASKSTNKQNLFETNLLEVRHLMGDDAYESAWAKGSAMTLDDVIALEMLNN